MIISLCLEHNMIVLPFSMIILDNTMKQVNYFDVLYLLNFSWNQDDFVFKVVILD